VAVEVRRGGGLKSWRGVERRRERRSRGREGKGERRFFRTTRTVAQVRFDLPFGCFGSTKLFSEIGLGSNEASGRQPGAPVHIQQPPPTLRAT